MTTPDSPPAAHFRATLLRDPRNLAALRGLAGCLSGQGDFAAAVDLLFEAFTLAPGDLVTLSALGNALVNARRPDDALAFLQRAAELAPEDARVHNNLGLALADCGLFAQAQEAYAQALRLAPGSAMTLSNLGCLQIMMARHDEALRTLDAALAADPHNLPARRNRALALLSLGQFQRGWADYDWCAQGVPQPPDPFPRWTGQPLEGRRILLTAHQGLGDTLQFIRYAAPLRALADRVMLECPPPLLEVLASAPGVDELVPRGSPLPAANLCVPVMALPRIFGTTVETIPAPSPYLRTDPARLAAWRDRLGPRAAGERRIGLCWQGNPHHQWDRFRSLPLRVFAPLARVPGVTLVSLQRGPGAEQIDAFQAATGGALRVLINGRQDAPGDLADSAALMHLLDLVVTVDTAPAHLAGALGGPVWLLLSRTADWRWLTGRTDTPWYPAMRLFRQETPGDWTGVIDEVARALACLPPAPSAIMPPA